MSLALEWKEPAHQARREGRRQGEIGEKEAHKARQRVQRSRRHRLMFVSFLIVAASVCGLLILTVFLHVAVVQNEIKAREMERQIDLERRHQEEIRVEIAGLESPARVEKIAVEELKMVQVAQALYLQTPAFQAAKIREKERLADKEAMVSDAIQGDSQQNQDIQR